MASLRSFQCWRDGPVEPIFSDLTLCCLSSTCMRGSFLCCRNKLPCSCKYVFCTAFFRTPTLLLYNLWNKRQMLNQLGWDRLKWLNLCDQWRNKGYCYRVETNTLFCSGCLSCLQLGCICYGEWISQGQLRTLCNNRCSLSPHAPSQKDLPKNRRIRQLNTCHRAKYQQNWFLFADKRN
jgi:hypothetical protein